MKGDTLSPVPRRRGWDGGGRSGAKLMVVVPATLPIQPSALMPFGVKAEGEENLTVYGLFIGPLA